MCGIGFVLFVFFFFDAGRGHFAVVKLARHVFTGEKVAVKVIDKTKLDEVSRAHLFQEVRCMKLVQHPNVVRLYEVIDTQTKLYLILELGDGGDLYDYIMRHENGLDQESARHYFRQVVPSFFLSVLSSQIFESPSKALCHFCPAGRREVGGRAGGRAGRRCVGNPVLLCV